MLILIRGLPGSGKSTQAKKYEGFVHVEADMYLIGPDGVYRFDPKRLGEAHAWCRNTARAALAEGKNVVVSNTFTTRAEIEPYITMAHELGVTMITVTMTGNWGSIHGVPEATMENMRRRWEEF